MFLSGQARSDCLAETMLLLELWLEKKVKSNLDSLEKHAFAYIFAKLQKSTYTYNSSLQFPHVFLFTQFDFSGRLSIIKDLFLWPSNDLKTLYHSAWFVNE